MRVSFYFILYIFHVLRLDSVDAAAFILPEQSKPEKFANEAGCYVPELGKVLAYKKPYSPQDDCIQYTCNEDNSTSIYTCGVISIPNNCSRVPGNTSLPYPQCCDGISCPEQPAPEDPNLEEFPVVKDHPANSYPPVSYPRPCPTCPFEPGNADPGSVKKTASSSSVNSEQEEPSDHVPVVIPPNAPRAPICAYFTDSSSDTREIPPYCPPVVFEPVDTPSDKSVAESVDEPLDKPLVEPVAEPVVDPVVEPAVEPKVEPEVEQPAPEDPNLEEFPVVKDHPANSDPPVSYPRPCPTCPFEPGNADPGSVKKTASSSSVNSEQEEPSDHVPVVIPPNAPRAPFCAYFTDSSSDTREIPPYCPPVVFEPVDTPSNKSVPESVDEPVDKPLVEPVAEPVVDPVVDPVVEPAVEPKVEPEVEQPAPEDPNLEEFPVVKDHPANSDPPVSYPRPCPTCPFEPGNADPGSVKKTASSSSVNSEQEEPSDHVPVVIPPNAPRAPFCAYFTDSSSDTREIPPYCPPVVFEPVDTPSNKSVPESVDEPVDKPLVEPVAEPVVDPVVDPVVEPAVEPKVEPEVELPAPEDPNLEEFPVVKDPPANSDPPVSYPRPCPTCPFEPGNADPGSVKKTASSSSVNSEQEEPSDHVPVVIPPNASRPLICAFLADLSSDIIEIPYCSPVEYEPVDAPSDKSVAEYVDDLVDEPVGKPLVEPVVDPVVEPAVELMVEPAVEPEVEPAYETVAEFVEPVYPVPDCLS